MKRSIDHMAHVDDLTQATCANDYLVRSNASMRVCATCGAADPFDQCTKVVQLLELPRGHWMRADGDALERLRAADDLVLVRCEADGSLVTGRVPRLQLHNVAVVQGAAFHAVPEAVRADGHCRLCQRCAFGWEPSLPARHCDAWAAGVYLLACSGLWVALLAHHTRHSTSRHAVPRYARPPSTQARLPTMTTALAPTTTMAPPAVPL